MKVNEEHHHHDHDHQHHHHKHPESFDEVRTMAIESLLIEKGLISAQEVDELIHHYVSDIGPMNGAKVVARAWMDPEFKQRLLQSGHQAAAELGIGQIANELVVLENTSTIHHVVVCTLCSCYPWALLGLPPTWYKSTAYRSRVVIDPRSVLREFGLELDDTVEIRVVDSNAEVRYLILPERPQGTEHMTEAELAALITRDSMIGVTKAAAPLERKGDVL
ncbi:MULTISPECIES: nitrile hydratase subunit alpha [unclassified Paenibacillus]|uniref:nitrile hydratase subunit alpha n=1 Tax=unclassified Paenibacillus TaxID=185978 RepID=UPI001AEAF004|nr:MULTISPECIES: nitrile hydratase subunit alpha [unclassified Paenibacillus]MBP1154113.1 nitrile hydratase [Paenibacillus sp. PvP091]MBP1170502.1 nitrile hydratase [Paenibacillus sp. PvR098]MBP2441530.1 nitrile hydratase [Paenibacillus sp. PvP052]